MTPLCGWLPHSQRTPEQRAMHERIVGDMPEFHLVGADRAPRDKVYLWEAVRKLLPPAAAERFLTAYRQEIGCCVGAGSFAAQRIGLACEIAFGLDPEVAAWPFMPYVYGRSRWHAGIRGPGSGSTGAGAAKAVCEDGTVCADRPGLPAPSIDGRGLAWGEQIETAWSNGGAIAANWLEEGRKHRWGGASLLRSADDVREAIRNYYPCTIASDWGGMMRCAVVDGVLLNRRVTQWMHQMATIGWWDHPTLGEIFYVMNSWGPQAHGECPSGAPPGGFWVRRADMDAIVRQNDSFSLFRFQGWQRRRPDLDDFHLARRSEGAA